MALHTITIILTLLLLAYHQITTWLPLHPWNNLEAYSTKEILLEAGSNGLLMGLGAFCVIMGNSGFYHYYPLFYYPFLLTGEIFQWWLPYFSPKFARSNVNFDYEPKFSNTVKLILHKTGKRTPDANHIVLHALSLLTAMLVYLDRFIN